MCRMRVLFVLLGMSVSGVVLASPAPPPGSATSTEAEILSPRFVCSSFDANIKNTGAVAASYASTLVITKRGDCAKWEKDRNPNGSKCKTGELCFGYCAAYGPDKEVKFSPTPKTMSIPAGATKPLQIGISYELMKKAEITVLEEGKVSAVSKSVAPGSPCIP